MHKSVAITNTHDLGNGYSRCALVVLGTRTRKLDAYFFDPSSQFHRRHLRHLLPLADVISSLRASSYSGLRSYRARTSFRRIRGEKAKGVQRTMFKTYCCVCLFIDYYSKPVVINDNHLCNDYLSFEEPLTSTSINYREICGSVNI